MQPYIMVMGNSAGNMTQIIIRSLWILFSKKIKKEIYSSSVKKKNIAEYYNQNFKNDLRNILCHIGNIYYWNDLLL
jgi:hypothetical protein